MAAHATAQGPWDLDPGFLHNGQWNMDTASYRIPHTTMAALERCPGSKIQLDPSSNPQRQERCMKKLTCEVQNIRNMQARYQFSQQLAESMVLGSVSTAVRAVIQFKSEGAGSAGVDLNRLTAVQSA